MNTEEKINKLQNELATMGFGGLAYTELWNQKAKELNELKATLKSPNTTGEKS